MLLFFSDALVNFHFDSGNKSPHISVVGDNDKKMFLLHFQLKYSLRYVTLRIMIKACAGFGNALFQP